MSDKNYYVTLTERELLIAVFALSATERKLEGPSKYEAHRIAVARYGALASKLDGLLTEQQVVDETTTGEVIHDCGFVHPTTAACPVRNPFYFGDSITTNEPVTQADGVGLDSPSLLVDEFGTTKP